jgi:hypothetical protein
MQACIASGYFFTMGISFLEKKFWKISHQLLKKSIILAIPLKGKTGKGFYRFIF